MSCTFDGTPRKAIFIMEDVSQICNAGDYGSEFEYDSEIEKKRKKREDLAKSGARKQTKLPEKGEVTEEYSREVNRHERFHLLSLDAYARHKKFINDYLLYYGGSRKEFVRDSSRDKTDYDVLRENHKFLWTDEDDVEQSWEKRLAKRYHDKLFKEYCIGDLIRYKENKIALRWRIESEVVNGKGQFVCGEKRCEVVDQLRSWEVNFAYVEQNQKKNALVKIRLCPECSQKLNYHHRRREVKKRKLERKLGTEDGAKKRKRDEESTEDPTSVAAAATAAAAADKGDDAAAVTKATGATSNEETNLWSQTAPIIDDKPREDEFEEYFEDMFL